MKNLYHKLLVLLKKKSLFRQVWRVLPQTEHAAPAGFTWGWHCVLLNNTQPVGSSYIRQDGWQRLAFASQNNMRGLHPLQHPEGPETHTVTKHRRQSWFCCSQAGVTTVPPLQKCLYTPFPEGLGVFPTDVAAQQTSRGLWNLRWTESRHLVLDAGLSWSSVLL